MQPSKVVYEYFANYIFNHTGIHYPEQNYYQLDSRLTNLMKFVEVDSFEALLDKFKSGIDSKMHQMLIDISTNNETYFFRDPLAFDAMEKIVFPKWKNQDSIHIWSAACSTGQEIYSVMMLLDEKFPEYFKKDINFYASDISHKVLERTKKAQYTQLEVQRGLPIFKLSKYFSAGEDNSWQFKTDLASKVKTFEFNLYSGLYPQAKYDLILCRNILIYQPKDNKQIILNKIEKSLKPEGCLVLGSTENIIGIDLKLQAEPYERIKLYRKVPEEVKKAS